MDTVSRRGRRDVETVFDRGGMVEVFVEGVDVFEDAAAGRDDEVIDCYYVLGVFGQGDAADVLRRG